MSRTGNPAAAINNLDLFERGRWGIRSYLHCRSCAIDQLQDVPIDKNGDDVMVIYLRPLAGGGGDKRGKFRVGVDRRGNIIRFGGLLFGLCHW